MITKIKDVFPERVHPVMDSIFPGGVEWHWKVKNVKKFGCLKSCPTYEKCRGCGPSGKLCSVEWTETPAKTAAFMVLKHIFDNFHYYNCDDLADEFALPLASEISEVLDFPFESNLSPAEALAIVKVRLKQAEFKANLFLLWEGCSIDGIEIAANYLIASHIKPWAQASDSQKVSRYNGLLLPTNYDYLFDRHLISFNQHGMIMLHSLAELENLYGILGIDPEAKLSFLPEETMQFLSGHNEQFHQVHAKMTN
ncbi:HNH endonuclease [Shewanella avicenniae]|uniref:HNH endonuclease n=1 Tax=Shewanella avicenniae TaxID=2814294 RepID=A0ABX7QVQ4_9GAMM|nr:HNH endonuclease [Shewanella avicenniae]QSX35344.1 HNH endonuclease [Shewanella avicenniae]